MMDHDFHVPGFHDQPASITNYMPPIERAVFILHGMEDVTYKEIADRLAIDVAAVTAFMAEAQIVREILLRGRRPEQRSAPVWQKAEAALRSRFRIHCEARLAARGFRTRIEWRAGEDEEQSVCRAVFDSLRPVDLETFLLSRVDGFGYAQIARHMGTFQWIVERRMVRAIYAIGRGYCSFANWLIQLGRNPDATLRHAHRPLRPDSVKAVQ